jgi:hypothetical protein
LAVAVELSGVLGLVQLSSPSVTKMMNVRGLGFMLEMLGDVLHMLLKTPLRSIRDSAIGVKPEARIPRTAGCCAAAGVPPTAWFV